MTADKGIVNSREKVAKEKTDNVLAGYITEDELAGQLGLTTRTLLRWRKQRVGPPVTTVGRQILYRIAAVESWLLSCEMEMVREKKKK